MTFYHGTDEESWNAIQKEGVLWGRRYVQEDDKIREVSRCTYLAVDEREAMLNGDIVLKVEYEPTDGNDNYVEGCWQLRVYVPIPLKNVTRIM